MKEFLIGALCGSIGTTLVLYYICIMLFGDDKK